MGINIDEIFGKAKDAAEKGMTDLLKTGGNAALGFLEGQAIDIIRSDKEKHEQASQAAVQEILNRPSSPFGEYVSNLMKNPVINNYGPYIMFALAGAVGLGIYLRSK